jgi:hypothetical protein
MKRLPRWFFSLPFLFGFILFAASAPAAPPAIRPGSWTLAILPDTQNYAEAYPDIFTAQTKFLADAKQKLNLAFVLQEGDATNQNTAQQWQRVSDAFALLEKAGVGYAIAPGNHDYSPAKAKSGTIDIHAASLMDGYFPVERLKKQPTFGGVFPNEPNSSHNSYWLFSAGKTDWLVLALEFGPRDEVVAWADRILKKYPRRTAVLLTHAYLYSDGTRYDWAAKGNKQPWNPHAYAHGKPPGGVNDGEELWQKLKGNANLKFVFCGHVLNNGAGYLASRGDRGNVVHQMLANYQFLKHGGMGYLRLLEFLPDGETVHVRTYSPWLDRRGKDPNRVEPNQDFTLELSTMPNKKKAFPVPK